MKKISSFILSIILILSNLLIVNMLIAPIGINNAVAFPGGNGTPGNPFQVGNVTDLQNMSADLSAHYILINDIDCTVTSGWNGGLGFSPIANDTNPGAAGKQGANFTGSFNGQNYKIFNLTINRSAEDYVGLFGYVVSGSKITNCTINGTISGNNFVGGFAGYNAIPVDNCHTEVDISGYDNVGGIAGFGTSDVTNSTSSVTVGGHFFIGGLVGQMMGNLFINCSFSGQTSGSAYIGGIAGKASGTTVMDCFKTETTKGGDFLGGLVGSVDSCTFDNVWGNGTVDGGQWVGGLIGYTDNNGKIINASFNGTIKATSSNTGGIAGFLDSGYTLTYSNSTVDMAGTINVGGIVGNSQGIIDNVNSSGMIKSTGVYIGGLVGTSIGTVIGDQYVGGIAGENQITIENSDFYGNVNGITNDIGGIVGRAISGGLIQKCNNYGYINGNSVTGGIVGNLASGIPVIDCINFGSVNGTGDVGGIVGQSSGSVTTCTSNGNITGSNNDVGGLVGQNDGTVTNCKAFGTANSTDLNVGGLIGYHTGIVTNSVAWGDAISLTNFIGGLIGTNDATVTNCTAYGNAIGNGAGSDYVGGLIGESWGPVSFCMAFGSSNGTGDYIGGLIGNNEGAGASVTNCTAYGDADGAGGNSQYTGGLIGWNEGGIVTNCSAYGNVSGTGWEVGGLIGENAAGSVVTNSHAYGDVYGWRLNGGLIAYNSGTVTNCTASGTVIGTDEYHGGLIGYTDGGSITNCIAYGSVTGTGASGNYVGGLIGMISGLIPVSYCTAYGDAEGTQDYVGGLIGYSSGGVISDCTAYGNATGPTDEVGGLIGEFSAGGSAVNCTAYGNAFGDNDVGGLIGLNFATISNCTAYGDATGTADGLGGLIGWNYGDVDNCTSYGDAIGIGIDSGEIGGLMGYNDVKTVENCISYGNAAGPTEHVGGLIGENKGPVTKCISYGSVTGATDWIGGLIGWNDGGTISICAAFGDAIGNATGHDYVGGLIGDNSGGSVENCYSHGNVTGNVTVGGLIGYNDGPVNASYSLGFVIGDTNVGGLIGNNASSGSVTNCYWDNVTSGQTTSAGGAGAMGRNTTEMQKEATFTGAGWNFTGIWAIIDGKTYPYFGNFYNPPKIMVIENDTAFEGSLYSVDFDAYLPSYPPGNYIDTWTVTTNGSSWLSIDSNGILSGTPTNDDLGTFWVNVTMTDIYGGTDSHNFTLTVLNVNSPPVITTPNNVTAIEDMLYTVDYDATDPDPTGDSIFWNYMTNATWLNFNQLTGVLFGWPVNADVGSYWVNITVTDGKGGESSVNFTLNVININGEPLITNLDVLTAYEDALYAVDYNATDEEDDTLAWSMTTNSTSFWLGIDTVTGVLSGIPDNLDVGEIWVNITVDDGNGGTVHRNFTLTILNTNDDPIITTTDKTTATEDMLYLVDYEVSDEDIDNVHTWTLSTDATWLNLDDSTGVLSGVPTNADVGSYWVKVTVDDYHGGTVSHNFTLTVLNTNDAPSITTTDIETAVEDDLYSVQYNASDIDPTADIFTWTLVTDAEWLSIGASSGILSGTPDNDDVGTYIVNISVDDGQGGITRRNFTLTVTNVNDDPVITTTDVTTATADELYSVDYNATDIDPTNDVFTWSKTGAGWLSIDSITGILSGTPSNDNAGTYSIDVTVIDGNGGSDVNTFILTVEPVTVITNLDPVISTTDIITITAGELYTQTYDATDDRTLPADLTWTMTSNAGWLDFDATTRVLSGTPAEIDEGIYWVSITVNDGEGGSDSTNFNVTVIVGIENTRPVLTAGQMSPTSGDTDTSFTFTVHYQDADGDAPESVNVMIDGEIHEMALESGDSSDGTYSYTTKLSEGTHSYYFTANDGTDNAVSGDNTPTNFPDAESTSGIEEPEEEGVTDWTLYLILIIVVIIIIAIIAFAMSRRGGAPLTEESFFIDEEEEMAAKDMASEEDLDEDEAVSEAEGESAEDEEEVEGFECPTCGAVLTETDTKCLECGEEFEDD
jgi:hypothetical protein